MATGSEQSKLPVDAGPPNPEPSIAAEWIAAHQGQIPNPTHGAAYPGTSEDLAGKGGGFRDAREGRLHLYRPLPETDSIKAGMVHPLTGKIIIGDAGMISARADIERERLRRIFEAEPASDVTIGEEAAAQFQRVKELTRVNADETPARPAEKDTDSAEPPVGGKPVSKPTVGAVLRARGILPPKS